MSKRRRPKIYSIADVTAARVAFQRAHAPKAPQTPPTQQPAPHDLAAGEGVATVLGGRTQPLASDGTHAVRGEGATPSNTERGDA